MTIENVLDKYEYSKKDLIGHGAFAVVFKGKSDQVKWGPSSLDIFIKKILSQYISRNSMVFWKKHLNHPNQDKNLHFFNRNESC